MSQENYNRAQNYYNSASSSQQKAATMSGSSFVSFLNNIGAGVLAAFVYEPIKQYGWPLVKSMIGL